MTFEERMRERIEAGKHADAVLNSPAFMEVIKRIRDREKCDLQQIDVRDHIAFVIARTRLGILSEIEQALKNEVSSGQYCANRLNEEKAA